MVPMGTEVEYIYEPVLIGFRQGHVYLSVYEVVYFKIRSMIFYVLSILEQRGLSNQVNMLRVMQTVEEETGMAIDVNKTPDLHQPR